MRYKNRQYFTMKIQSDFHASGSPERRTCPLTTRKFQSDTHCGKAACVLPVLIIICACLYLGGCSRATVETKQAEQGNMHKVEKPFRHKQPVTQGNYQPFEQTVDPPDQSAFKKPIEYFGRIPSYPLHRLPEHNYPDFSKDIHGKAGLKRALKQSISYYEKMPPSKEFYFGDDKYNARHMLLSLKKFLDFLESSPSTRDIHNFLAQNYSVYTTIRQNSEVSRINGKASRLAGQSQASIEIDPSVLFTGYYEPLLKGSLVKEGEYIYPVYSKPNDLIDVPRGGFSGKYRGTPASGARRNGKKQLVPYYTRAEIDSMKGFEKHAKPLVWVNCRIDRFFLEIQGSGRVELKQGGTMRVQYHSKNGRPYRSIGKYLVDKGEIAKEDVSMQSIRKWLDNNPSRVDEVLNYNPSFVFFREGNGGPVGCLGVEVTQMRSIATDKSIFPKGALCFMDTTIPTWKSREDNISWRNHSAFVLNQDTGGAIRGTGRADYFCGNGRYAELAAGYMKQFGRLYFLVLKQQKS
ncbi:MAG: MltA domain-containing protein [Desulfamplus sp.]|nr:MltA domain-containing protein [Desulfamplus sp.]